MTQQRQVTGSAWLPVTLMAATTLMLIAAIVAFIAGAPGVGDACLGAVFVVAAVTGGAAAVNRARAVPGGSVSGGSVSGGYVSGGSAVPVPGSRVAPDGPVGPAGSLAEGKPNQR